MSSSTDPDPQPNVQPSSQESATASRDFFTVEQAADYLQVATSSIRSYIRKGILKAFRIAGKRKVLIAREDLHALLIPVESEDKDVKPEDLVPIN